MSVQVIPTEQGWLPSHLSARLTYPICLCLCPCSVCYLESLWSLWQLQTEPVSVCCHAFPGTGSVFVPRAASRTELSSGCQTEGAGAAGSLWWRQCGWESISLILLYMKMYCLWLAPLPFWSPCLLHRWQVRTLPPALAYHTSWDGSLSLSWGEMVEWDPTLKTSSSLVVPRRPCRYDILLVFKTYFLLLIIIFIGNNLGK